MTIAIGSDHGGYELKLEVIKHLKDRGFEVTDYGCDSTASCDYPIYGKAVAEAIAAGKQDLGILICGTGIGMSMQIRSKVSAPHSAVTVSLHRQPASTTTPMYSAWAHVQSDLVLHL